MAVLLGVLLLAAVGAGALQASYSGRAVEAVVNLSTLISGPVSSDFASFSLEVPCAPKLFADNSRRAMPASPRQSYVNLLAFLRNTSISGLPPDIASNSPGPNVRIGGNSADESFFVGSAQPPFHLPSGDKHGITSSDIETYSYALLWNGTLVIDVSLRNATSPLNSLAYAIAAVGVNNRYIESFEIGNEPYLFSFWKIRPVNYTFDDYESDFELYAHAFVSSNISALSSKPIIQGGTFRCVPGEFGWSQAQQEQFIRRFSSSSSPPSSSSSLRRKDNENFLHSISFHFYPLSACGGQNVTIDELLSLEAAVSVSCLKPYAAVAAEQGIPFYLGEGNSISCGGTKGVSDTFASALWAVDAMLVAASSGVQRWNFHGCAYGSPYSPIELERVFLHDNESDDIAVARPLYYGMWVFSFATSASARLVSVTLQTALPSLDPAAGRIRLWSTLSTSYVKKTSDEHREEGDTEGSTTSNATCQRLVFVAIHKGMNMSEGATTVTLQLVGGSGTVSWSHFAGAVCSIRTLRTDSKVASATSGIFFGNQTFDGSRDGRPSGQLVETEVAVSSSGFVSFSLHPLTVAVGEMFHCT